MEIVEFKKSPLMSANYVAFVVGNLESVENKSMDNEVMVRVFACAGKGFEGLYAMEVGRRTIPFLSKYLSFPLPLQKVDMVAVPEYPHSMLSLLKVLI